MAGALIRLDWRDRAACRGPQAREFYPPGRGERRDEKYRRGLRAKDVCSRCSVVDDCLEYAVGIRETHGIWGGTSEVERRVLIGLSA